MQLNLSSISLEIPRQVQPALRGWMLGQLLDATVIGRDTQNSIRLNVGGTEVRAATALPLRAGENLILKVTQLKPVITLTPVGTGTTPEKLALNATVSRILPLQRPLVPTLEFLREAVRTPEATSAPPTDMRPLPDSIQRAAQSVLATVPNLRDVVDAKQLPGILRQLGVLAESNTFEQSRSGPVRELPAQDLKWQLLRLRGTLAAAAHQATAAQKAPLADGGAPRAASTHKPADPQGALNTNAAILSDADGEMQTETSRQMMRLVDGAIARIETNQLKTVSALLDGEVQLSLDLPVAMEDGYKEIRLQVRRDESTANGSGVESNTMVLEIPLTAQASVRAVVTLSGDELSVRLWSTDSELRRVLAGTRETLLERLKAGGLGNVSVSVTELKPFEHWGRTFDQLVDTTA